MSKKKVLVLRTCNADMTSHNGFRWPKQGPVEATDWEPTYKCGHGLHGLLWGEGDGPLLNWSDDAVWQVVRVEETDILTGKDDLLMKCKYPKGEVVFSGDRKSATDYLLAHGAVGKAVVGCYKTGGHRSTLTGGDGSTLTGGHRSTLTGGDWSALTGGDWSTLTGGYRSTLTWKVWDGWYHRLHTAYVGENGIEANEPYIFNGKDIVSV